MSDPWSLLLEAARTSAARVGPAGGGLVREGTGWRVERPDPLLDLLVPVLDDRVQVVAHLAQSLDGRIALSDGRSRWISGDEDLTHTHRLRALCDAVLVGAHTVAIDDPQLTVRRVPGPSPVRVVLDPGARIGRDRAVFRDDGCWRISAVHTGEPGAIVLPAPDGVFDPRRVVDALLERGIRRILIEGGGVTVSRFVAAGVVDRLHLVVASVLVGAGRAGLELSRALADTLDACPRPAMRAIPLGTDVLLDCPLTY